MESQKPFRILIFLLIVVGIGLCVQRHIVHQVPLFPGERQVTWSVEARVSFLANGGPVDASLALPNDPAFKILSENAASPGYGLTIEQTEEERRADWTVREAKGKQELYFILNLVPTARRALTSNVEPTKPEPVVWNEGLGAAAKAVSAEAWKRSANNLSFTRELIRILTEANPTQNVSLLLQSNQPAPLLRKLLAAAGIPSHVVHGLQLEDGRKRQTLDSYVEVYHNGQWMLFNPVTGEEGRPPNFLLWARHDHSILDLMGGSSSSVSFTMMRSTQPALATAQALMTQKGPMPLSLYQLPLEEQNMFRGILLLPVGVMIVVFLQIMIGLRTSGTFMPVLIAIAFIQTTLINGIVGLLLIVSAGLLIRGYLSQLNLLLVSRISAVVVVVIGIIGLFTMVAYNMGLSDSLTITFFPMIILAWTIERMSILWEEEGPREVALQGGGSLFVATVSYLAMQHPLVQHWVFNFLGIHCIILALILLMGQYTGYRLLELRRFSAVTLGDA